MMKTNEINIRDPFVLTYEGKYYMYGTRVGIQTGFDVYVSEDLEHWSRPKAIFEYYDGFWGQKEFWAPEVHLYKEKFYLFATFRKEGTCRGTAILVSEHPEGPFVEHSDGVVTPADWECLDGTFYVSPEEKPYMVFCHEWLQIGDGTVCAIELSKDLKCSIGEPRVLWRASDVSWVINLPGEHEINYVTDGPYLLQVEGELIALWSSYGKNGYTEAIVRSNDNTITGEWVPDEGLLYDGDGGHGMVFETFEGELIFVYHTPNAHFEERPVFKRITKKELMKC